MKSKILIPTIFVLLLFIKSYGQNTETSSSNYIITTDLLKLYAKKSGKGPVCIFIHGGPGAWSKSFEDLGGKNLEKHLSMVYYDQRGCGRSDDALNNDYSLDRMLQDIEDIRKSLDVEKVYLMSHSFGGVLAVNYASKYPEHTKGIILANSTLNILYSVNGQTNYINQLLGTDYTATTEDAIFPTFIEATKKLNEEGLGYKRLSDVEANVEKVDSIDITNPSSYQFAQNALSIDTYLQDYTTITPSIKCPVLVITGKKDHAIGIEHYKSFRFPNQQVVQIDGGHILYFENNEEFIDAVFEFVKSTKEI